MGEVERNPARLDRGQRRAPPQQAQSSEDSRGVESLRARRLMALGCATLALGLVAGCGSDDDEGGGTSTPQAEEGGGGDSGGTVKIGILSDCEGAFGSFFEPTASGANLALIRQAGGKPAGEKPTDGIEGAEINGHPIEIVGYG